MALAAALLVASPATAASQTYYVDAAQGSNANSGLSLQQAKKTIQAAASVAAAGDTILVRAGTYRETVTPNSGLSFRPYNSEVVVVSGADPVSGWTAHQNGIYKASFTANSSLFANQVFIGDQMVPEARWPNTSLDPTTPTWATMGSGTTTTVVQDSAIPSFDWSGGTIHIWAGTNPFAHQTGSISSSSAGSVTFSAVNGAMCPFLCAQPGGRYYLLGKLAALDADNEWFYDGSSELLYLRAPGGVVPTDVSAKKRDYSFDLRGRSNVTIQGIRTFANTIITDAASSGHTIDGLNARYLSHYTTLPSPSPSELQVTAGDFDNVVSHVLDSGIQIRGTNNTLKNSTLSYSAGNGVLLLGSGHSVENNRIEAVNYMGSYAAGISMSAGDGNRVLNNTISNTGRDGININDTQGKTFPNHRIAYNNIFDTTRQSIDSGGIYACCQVNGNTSRIDHNWVHDLNKPLAANFPTAGIYIDNSSYNFLIEQNAVWKTKSAGIFLHGNRDTSNGNVVRDNDVLVGSERSVWVLAANSASGTSVANNRVVLPPVVENGAATGVSVSGNGPSANGANEARSPGAGCNFASCGSTPPSRVLSTVANMSFEANGAFADNPASWLTAASDPAADYVEQNDGGHSGRFRLTHWNPDAYWAYTYQTLTGLPNGTYTLTAWVKSSGGQDAATILVKTQNKTVTKDTAIPASASWTRVTLTGVSVTDGSAEVAIYSNAGPNEWVNVDDVQFFLQ